jgi:RND family efflux transporter MFP subunit
LKIAQAQYDSAKAKLAAQLVGTRSQADAAKGSKDIAAIQLANTQIVAPFDGFVLSKNIEVGQSVSPGTPLFSVGNTDTLKVKMDVNGDQVGSFTAGKTAIVKKDNLTFTGIISSTSPGADALTKLFHVELLLDKNTKGILPGDFVDVVIEKKLDNEKVITIPFAALVAFEQGKYGIYTVGSGSTAVLRAVTIGAQNATQVEILSGLNEGESYVSNGALTIVDGDKINIVK